MKGFLLLSCVFFFLQFSYSQNIDSLVNITIENAEVLRTEDQNYDQAIKTLEELLEVIVALDTVVERIKLAPIYHKIGVNYYMKGDMDNSLKNNSRALEIRETKLGTNHIDVIRGYFNRGSVLRRMQDYGNAKNDIAKAIALMEKLIESKQSNDVPRLMRMYTEMYKINSFLKDNKTALVYWELVFNHYTLNESQNMSRIADLYNAKGIIYNDEKNYDLAIVSYLNSIHSYSRLKNSESEIEIGSVIHNLANSEQASDQFVSSKKHYLKAVDVFKKNQNSNNNLDIQQRLGNTYTDLTSLCSKTKEWAQGIEYFNQALKYTTSGWGTFHHPRVAEIYRNRTKISLGQNLFHEALKFNQKSLHALLPDFKTDDPFVGVNLKQHAVKNKNSFLETIAQKAEIFTAIFEQEGRKDQKYLEAAFKSYLTIDTVITQIRQSYEAQGSQFELIEQSYPVYEKAISTALELFKKTGKATYLEAAYHFAAKNKAMVLLAGMQEEQAKAWSSIPQELREKEKNLKRSIFQLESKIYEQADQEADPVLRDSLFALRRAYQKLIIDFESAYPDYYDLKYRFDKTISVAALQQQLSRGSCMLEYFVGDASIFVFVITQSGFDYVKFEKPEQFEERCLAFRQKMETPGNGPGSFSDHYQLFEWLVKSPLEKAEKREEIHHLIFLPDGPLLQLSFDVLVRDNTSTTPQYLLKDYAISYAYSNRLLFGNSAKKRARHTFAGFGLEYDDYTLADLATYVDNPLASLPLSRALGHLEFSDDEINEIAGLLHGDAWINQNATREAFLQNAGDYVILHLATHGVLNEQYPMNSALIFTRQNDSTAYFLRAADLYGLTLNADMAVLSACNTGAGMVERGEGVRSLARAFSAAGCPSLIASLWNASDQSTKEILVDFYKNLKKGQTKAEAMRNAKLTYLENAPPTYQAPYYWSHLNVIGESGPLDVLNVPLWRKYWYLVAAGLAVMAGGVYSSRKKRHKIL